MATRLHSWVPVWCVLTSLAVTQEITIETVRGGPGPAKNEAGADSDGRPWLAYARNRASVRSVPGPNNTRHAVDDGIAWKGVSYGISLTYDLLAVPETSPPKATWVQNVSAFWNRISIESWTPPDETEARDVIALRSRGQEGLAEFRDLATGNVLGKADPPPPGKPLRLLAQWSGDQGLENTASQELVDSPEAWSALRQRLFAEGMTEPPVDPEMDWKTHFILVIYGGKAANCSGFSGTAFEADDALIVRSHAATFQTMGYVANTRPWGVLVVPRCPGKPIVLERNRQRLIGGPELWTEWRRFEPLSVR